MTALTVASPGRQLVRGAARSAGHDACKSATALQAGFPAAGLPGRLFPAGVPRQAINL